MIIQLIGMLALMRTIKFVLVLDTEEYCLKIKPSKHKGMFYLEEISDSEYAGEKIYALVSMDMFYFSVEHQLL
jgi:hypothetical protein